jgi:hypothetical protein
MVELENAKINVAAIDTARSEVAHDEGATRGQSPCAGRPDMSCMTLRVGTIVRLLAITTVGMQSIQILLRAIELGERFLPAASRASSQHDATSRG